MKPILLSTWTHMVCACACTGQIQVSVHRNTHVTVNLPPAEPCSDKVICILELKEDAESLMSEFSNVFVFEGCLFFFFVHTHSALSNWLMTHILAVTHFCLSGYRFFTRGRCFDILRLVWHICQHVPLLAKKSNGSSSVRNVDVAA